MLKQKRGSGILLHVTSLPSAFGIGDLGPQSYRFVDLLARNSQRFWSILPLSPTRFEDGNSPYHTSSAFAGNPLLVSPERLAEQSFIQQIPALKAPGSSTKVNFQLAYSQKEELIERAFLRFENNIDLKEFDAFCCEQQKWLNDYALYAALRKASGKPWNRWPLTLRKRDRLALAQKTDSLKQNIETEKFAQYLFFSQWQALRKYCRKQQVSIIGDMPFYVAYDSADVWVHPELFALDTKGQAKYVSGVPPDYFSASGQLWGDPVYNWEKLERTGFEWWIDRIQQSLTLYDELRLDHFRGFLAYWQVPGKAETARKGHWVKTPSRSFFRKLEKSFPSLPFVAEDLGYIDSPVREAIEELNLPGMKVLLFDFDGKDDNPHALKNHTECSVVYTGTHDTNTARGWFVREASAKMKCNVYKSIGKKVNDSEVGFELVKLALSSKSRLSIIPMQDVLGLGSHARMNNPSTSFGNWSWRVTAKQLENKKIAALSELTVENSRG